MESIRQDIINVCKRLRSDGYIFGTWGNASIRLEDGDILLTPSRVDYDVMRPEDLVVLGPDGNRVSGTCVATSERELHLGIFRARQDVNAIIHTHSTYAMAVAAIDGGIPPISEEMCQLIGGGIPLTEFFVPSEHHSNLSTAVVDAIGDKNALLIRNHGVICCGKSLGEAEICCHVTEKSSQMYLALLSSGQIINNIERKYIEMERQYYLGVYGKT